MIKAVLFDLGDTLIHPVGPWDPVMERACIALSQKLCDHGVEVPCKSFAMDFGVALRQYYAHRERNLEEKTTFILLKDLLAAGQYVADNTTIRIALDALYRITRSNWQADTFALPVVRDLYQNGIRLGILSNAGDDADVRALVEQARIDGYMDFIISSAKVGFRKPHERIFTAAMQLWSFIPSQISMVGDRLDADIRGAKQSGMQSVWITPDPSSIQADSPRPDYIIEGLDQLPGILAGR